MKPAIRIGVVGVGAIAQIAHIHGGVDSFETLLKAAGGS